MKTQKIPMLILIELSSILIHRIATVTQTFDILLNLITH